MHNTDLIRWLFLFLIHFVGCLRGGPAGLSALLSQTAVSQLLQSDLSPFHCSQDAEAEDEQPVVCKSRGHRQASLLLVETLEVDVMSGNIVMSCFNPHQCWSRWLCSVSS